MNISKDRLLEIEKELNGMSVKKLHAIGNLSQYGKSNFGKGALVAGKTQFTCPHCNLSGKSYFFTLIHFDNCKFKDIDFNQLNADIPVMFTKDLTKKYNLSRHLIINHAKQYNIPRKLELPIAPNDVKEKCIHCGLESTLPSIRRWHNDNCKHKK